MAETGSARSHVTKTRPLRIGGRLADIHGGERVGAVGLAGAGDGDFVGEVELRGTGCDTEEG